MTRYSDFHPPGGFPNYGQPPPPQKKKLPTWAWVILGIAGTIVLSCGGCVLYMWGGPEQKVYTGNELPAKYMSKMTDLGLLNPGEQIRFFYSDALRDIEDGFALVTDKKVVVYKKEAATPATHVPYHRIRSAELDESDSILSDSTITLKLDDGSVVSFPVSHDGKRDKMVLDSIIESIPKNPPATPGKPR